MAQSQFAPLSLLETAKALSDSTTTHAAVQNSLRARIAEAEPEIRAFTILSAVPAPDVSGPLAGLGVAVKDIFDTYDLPTAYGSGIYEGHRPATDASIITRLRTLGAHIVGKAVTTEFAYYSPGPTRNPVNPDHTPGGSSSGSAAAVAAGMAHAALGSQTAGSTIRPASYCGVTGYKPNFGLLPTIGVKTFCASLDTVGLFAQSVADVAFFAEALTGRSLRIDQDQDVVTAPRIGLYRGPHWDIASEDIRNALEATARQAEAAGAALIDLDPAPELAAADDAHAVIFAYEGAVALADEMTRHRSRLSAVLLELLDRGTAIDFAALDAARLMARDARLFLQDQFKSIDMILTPSAPGAAPEGIAATGTPEFNRMWTLAGNPCVNVAGLSDSGGLPLGMQVVGPSGDDRQALANAAWLEGVIWNA
ncbi:MAG: amidase [Pseudomonadota bacterium]